MFRSSAFRSTWSLLELNVESVCIKLARSFCLVSSSAHHRYQSPKCLVSYEKKKITIGFPSRLGFEAFEMEYSVSIRLSVRAILEAVAQTVVRQGFFFSFSY